MNTIIDSIKNRLATIEQASYVDEDWGQLDYYSPDFPVKWPCILIDVTTGKFDNSGKDKTANTQRRQTANAQIGITFANLKLSNSSEKAQEEQKENNYSIWQLVQKGHELLHGWRPGSNTGALMRVSFQRIKRDGGVQEITVVYTLGITNI